MAIQKVKQIGVDGFDVEYVPKTSSTGPADGGHLVALDDTTGRIDQTMLPAGVEPDAETLIASEDIADNALVNIWNNAGVPTVRNADASTPGKQADGFVLDAILEGETGLVRFHGLITDLSGLTPGSSLFLSDSAVGEMTATPVTTSGHILQAVGRAVTATEMQFFRGEPTLRA
jgi:hypothetical protein